MSLCARLLGTREDARQPYTRRITYGAYQFIFYRPTLVDLFPVNLLNTRHYITNQSTIRPIIILMYSTGTHDVSIFCRMVCYNTPTTSW